ncbi:AzlC family ABC transporter permease [Fusobacterium sp.]|uniref:AzlC family ABC transporter permease n=1 Tax=Fusobacterium sp. TaxID=68766 RepID=UPI002611163D|nr:AzlC family ABC transporter permease [Fusobacterium sp.]
MNKYELKHSFSLGVSVGISYIPIALTFGIFAKNSGLTLLEAFCFSFFVITGSGQIMGLNLWNAGTNLVGIWFTVLLMNLRLFLMGSSLSKMLNKKCKKFLPIIIPLITDESFALAALQEKKISPEFIVPIETLGHFFWWFFTIVGYKLGGILPKNISDSMGIGLYALFISMLIPQMKKSLPITIIVLMSGFFNWFIGYLKIFPNGWNMILAILISSFIGSFIFKDKEEENE